MRPKGSQKFTGFKPRSPESYSVSQVPRLPSSQTQGTHFAISLPMELVTVPGCHIFSKLCLPAWCLQGFRKFRAHTERSVPSQGYLYHPCLPACLCWSEAEQAASPVPTKFSNKSHFQVTQPILKCQNNPGNEVSAQE